MLEHHNDLIGYMSQLKTALWFSKEKRLIMKYSFKIIFIAYIFLFEKCFLLILKEGSSVEF